MSIWKDQGPAKKEAATPPTEPTPAGMREAAPHDVVEVKASA